MKCELCKYWKKLTFYTGVINVVLCRGFPFDKISLITRTNGLDEDITNIKRIETDGDFFCSGFIKKNSTI